MRHVRCLIWVIKHALSSLRRERWQLLQQVTWSWSLSHSLSPQPIERPPSKHDHPSWWLKFSTASPSRQSASDSSAEFWADQLRTWDGNFCVRGPAVVVRQPWLLKTHKSPCCSFFGEPSKSCKFPPWRHAQGQLSYWEREKNTVAKSGPEHVLAFFPFSAKWQHAWKSSLN